MVDSPADPSVRVYKYAVHGDLPAEAIEEMRRAHNLRNELVANDLAHEAAVATLWSEYPELDALKRRVEETDALIAELTEATKKERQRQRSTVVGSDLRERAKAARAQRRELKAQLRDAKARTYEQAKPRLYELSQQRDQKEKDLYAASVAAGLYWASYNDVLAQHKVARRMIAQKRKAGQPAQFRHHAWRGEGRIAVQLQHSTGQEPPTPALVADEGQSPWRNVAVLSPAHDPAYWATLRGEEHWQEPGRLRFRIGSEDYATMVEVPVIIHRPMPPEAEIKLLRITRRLVAGRPKVFVSVVVRLPSIPQRTEGTIVAMHCGWRSLGDGSMRVAVVSGVKEPPRELAEVVRWHGDWGEIVTPGPQGHAKRQGWTNVLAKTSEIRGTRDQMLDRLRSDLIAWLQDRDPVPYRDEPLTAAVVSRWRSPSRFVRLLQAWSDAPPEDSEAIIKRMRLWQRDDWHLWTWEANQRDQILGCRDDAWRKIGAWLCQDAAVLTVDGWRADVGTLIPMPEDEDTWQARRARANRVIAAPGMLRSAVENAASSRGVRVVEVTTQLSQTHHGCGGPLAGDDRRDAIMVPCPRCGHVVDQDVSALGHLLDASATTPPS